VGYIACEASKEPAARRGLLAEMHKLRGEGVQAGDLSRAKAYYSGSTRIQREANSALMREYASNVLLDLPLDRIDQLLVAIPNLSQEQVRAVAGRWLSGDDYVYAAVRGR